MDRRKAILIGCPQYGILVRGSYECDDRGRYLRGSDGEFVVDRVQCGQYGGRCMQTLCILHRHNRRGTGSWYPTGVFAAREPSPRQAGSPAKPAGRDDGLDCLV